MAKVTDDDGTFYTAAGPELAATGQLFSDLIKVELSKHKEAERVLCIAIAVIGDYARINFGDGYLVALAHVLLDRANHPMPVQDLPN